MCGISRKATAIKANVYYPKTEEGKQELARRAASVHADAAKYRICQLQCSSAQKEEMLDAVIARAHKNSV